MDFENLNIHSLPSLKIPERNKLPEIGAVYFLISEKNIVEYIGKAKNLRTRWHKHECCIDLDSPKLCRVAWIEIVDELERVRIEKSLIISLKPKLNTQHKSSVKPEFNRQELKQEILDSNKLLLWRENLGLTRDELARKLKTTYTTIYRWESGSREIPPYLDLVLETVETKLRSR